MQSIDKWATHTLCIEVMSFKGLTNYYLWFMEGYYEKVALLTASGETDPGRDLAATQFTKTCVAYNIIEFEDYKLKTI